MGTESNMRGRIVQVLAGLHPVAIESGYVNPGTPDVNFIGGWIELKCVMSWPARPSTPLRVPHFTNEQRIWLRKRCRAGGGAWVLLRVGKGHKADWIILRGDVAADHLGHCTRAELETHALRWWTPHLDEADLRRVLGYP